MQGFHQDTDGCFSIPHHRGPSVGLKDNIQANSPYSVLDLRAGSQIFFFIFILRKYDFLSPQLDPDSLRTCGACSSTWDVLSDDPKVVLSCFIATVVLDNNIRTTSLKPIRSLVKRGVVTTPINNTSSWTFLFCADPFSTFAGTSVALVRDLCSWHKQTAVVLTGTVTFSHTGTFAILKQSIRTPTARFTICEVTIITVQI